MYTNHKQAVRNSAACLMLLAGLVLASSADAGTNDIASTNNVVSTNETVVSTNRVAVDIKIDKALDALNPPVLQPVLYPPDEQKGAPTWPLYKEQPPAAQQDFRPPKPVEVPKPRERREPRPEPEPDPVPPPQPPPPPPIPCSPNHPNWPNC